MSENKPRSTTLSGIPDQRKPGDPVPPPPKSSRPKRRRKGQLNDGEWAPGYGPDAKKNERGMIQIGLFLAGALLLAGGVVATVRERKVEWRAFLGGVALIAAGIAMSWLPLLLHGAPPQ